MKKFSTYTIGLGLILTALTTACSDQSEELTSVDYDRVFAPFGLEAKVNNNVNVRLSWTPIGGATSYDIEIFQDDSLTFAGSPVRTYTELTNNDIPYDVTNLMGDTKYSARFKTHSKDAPESKWNGIFFKTDPEQLLTEVKEDDLTYSSAQFTWKADKEVTGIVLTPGDIKHTFSADELAACTATIEGLEGNTKYTARLVNGDKNCGERTFTTLIDPTTAILVSEDGKSLQEAIDEATPDLNLILVRAGTYEITALDVDKDVRIVGERMNNRPVIKGGNIKLNGGSVEMRNIILDGNGTKNHAFDYKEEATYAALNVENCEIRNFGKGLFYLNTASLVESITFDNCIIHDVVCSGADFMDSRKGAYKSLTFTNNTVYNTCEERDFVRYDNTAKSFPEVESKINVSNNTLIGISNASSKRIMYVRFAIEEKEGEVVKTTFKHTITFQNNLVTETKGYFSKQSQTNSAPTFGNNNYFKAEKAGTIEVTIDGAPKDIAKDETTDFDPKFKDAANGDFTITNEDLKINKVGDPRWLK